MGGMHKIVEGMVSLAREQGVTFKTNTNVEEIIITKGKAKQLKTNNGLLEADFIISSADYNHTDQHLLPKEYRNYTASYWDKRVMAPSSLLYYVGISKKLKGVKHHSLFFDKDFAKHAKEIYESPQWPSDPLFYVCAPSVTDKSVCPEGYENLFFLIPTAPGLSGDTEDVRNRYFDLIVDRFEKATNNNIKDSIVYYKSFAHKEFVSEYNAFKGNAYGLANTLNQTAILKPSIKNKKVSNLYYTGQLTNPGPGVPPSLISGQVVANQLIKENS